MSVSDHCNINVLHEITTKLSSRRASTALRPGYRTSDVRERTGSWRRQGTERMMYENGLVPGVARVDSVVRVTEIESQSNRITT